MRLDHLFVKSNVAKPALIFEYTRPGRTHASELRYIDLEAWDQGRNHKFWVTGSQAKGCTWRGYQRAAYQAGKRVLLCEGETDALAAIQARAVYDRIWALPGANMADEHLIAELAAQGAFVTLAFDNDDAGNAGVQKIAWLFGRHAYPDGEYPLERLVYDEGVNDLREQLSRGSYSWRTTKVVQTPQTRPAVPLRHTRSGFRQVGRHTRHNEDKPDLHTVWDRLSPRSKHIRRDGKGRPLKQAWCPLHDDGQKPAAWVGENRWGCFACGIESADVYELVAWVLGLVPPGQPLSGDTFLRAREEARRLS